MVSPQNSAIELKDTPVGSQGSAYIEAYSLLPLLRRMLGCLAMATPMDPTDPKTAWQLRFHKTVYEFGIALTELHNTNPWPDRPALEEAFIQLATELWDQRFSQTEIRNAYEAALEELPKYAAGDEIRP